MCFSRNATEIFPSALGRGAFDLHGVPIVVILRGRGTDRFVVGRRQLLDIPTTVRGSFTGRGVTCQEVATLSAFIIPLSGADNFALPFRVSRCLPGEERGHIRYNFRCHIAVHSHEGLFIRVSLEVETLQGGNPSFRVVEAT
jgi:hypothetical protein